MATKTDITLPPLPRHMDSVTAEEFDRRVLAWGRAAVEADRQHQVPSDIDLIAECVLTALRADDHGDLLRASDHGPLSSIKRALLSRHSIGQPAADLIRRMRNRLNVLASEDADMADQADAAALVAEADALLADQPVASAEADREKLMRAIVEAGQRAGIIRADPEAASVTECLHILECLSQPAASAEPDDMPPLDDRATYPASMIRRLIREDRARRAAPVAQEPAGYIHPDNQRRLEAGETVAFRREPYRHDGGGIPVFVGAAPVAARAQHAISGYTHTVPDDCETLHWRGNILSMNELASVAQPAVGEEIHIHIEGQDVLTLPLASSGMDAPRFVVHVPAQAQPIMPPLTDSMRAVLRNENDVYGDEDALYAALCDAAQAQPVVNQSLTTEREAFQRLLEYAESQICAHEETHRGGAIWEICDQCGARWADDEGGRPEFAWPKEIEDARAALAQQESGQDREDAADMFWDADDPERFGGDNLHDTLVDLADDYGGPDFPVTVRLQCAKRLPDVQVVVTGRNDDGELVYEVIDAARAAKGADHG